MVGVVGVELVLHPRLGQGLIEGRNLLGVIERSLFAQIPSTGPRSVFSLATSVIGMP